MSMLQRLRSGPRERSLKLRLKCWDITVSFSEEYAKHHKLTLFKDPDHFAADLSGPKGANMVKELRRIKKLRFSVRYRQSAANKTFTIETFSRNGAADEMFTRKVRETGKEETISVATYFKEQYNIRLRYPKLPCIKTKKKSEMFPMELAMIDEGQRYPYKLSERQTADMIKFTVTVSFPFLSLYYFRLTIHCAETRRSYEPHQAECQSSSVA